MQFPILYAADIFWGVQALILFLYLNPVQKKHPVSIGLKQHNMSKDENQDEVVEDLLCQTTSLAPVYSSSEMKTHQNRKSK